MGSRAFLLLGLLAAIVLLFASEVAARDLAETTFTTDKEDAVGVNDAKYSGGGYDGGRRGGGDGYGGGRRGGGGRYGGGGGRGGGGYGGGGERGGGRYGGGGRRGGGGYGGGRGRGGGGADRCSYGCCSRGSYDRCRCCASAAEAAQMGFEVKPEN